MVGNAAASRLTRRAVALGAYEFRLADASDDARLRELMREAPLPSWVELSFEREPSYFAGAGLGAEHHAMIASDARSGAVMGMCALTFRQSFVNGRQVSLAYLGELRLSARGKVKMLRSGFEALRRLIDWPASQRPCLTSIVEGNHAATRLLAGGVRGFPRYRRITDLHVAVLKSGARHELSLPGVSIAAAQGADEAAIAKFLLREYERFQFAPVWDQAALRAAPGLSAEDFILARKGGEIIGCAALWDQRRLRQTRVLGYAGSLARWRPLLNLIFPVAGLPRLPAPGAELKQVFLSHLAIAGDDRNVFEALLRHALGAARRRGAELVSVGLAETHPLRAGLVRSWLAPTYRSTLYLVQWADDPDPTERLDGRPVHVELAIL
jgi:hypothetical protein